MNLFFIHHRSPHHAKNSGYGRLVDYLDGKVIYGNIKFPFKIAKILAAFHSQKLGNYNVGSVLKAIELYKLLKKHKGQKNVVHFLNGERDIRHLGFFKKRFPNTFFCATFHKPPEILKKTITNVTALRKLDGAIAVGANQVDFLKHWLQLENVIYIPHGIDTQFFMPDASIKKENSLLFVGQHLRDFETFNKTVPILAEKIENLKIKVILHPAYKNKVKQHSNIDIITEVKDEELRKLYQEATLLYLPLLDCTACNSILEALACGLPIITSEVGGNLTYLEGTNNILVKKKNFECFLSESLELIDKPQRLYEIGSLSRNRSLELDWEKMATIIQAFYENSNRKL